MSRILIPFATVDGQTARIAERIGAALDEHDAVIIGGGIRFGHHARYLEAVVRDHLVAIAARPNAFFSVSLSAGGPGARPPAAMGYVEEFVERTGWNPRRTASFAGALRYTKYNAFIRFMMRLIVGAAGGDTDVSRDYEYTDWQAVERFAAEFAAELEPVRVA